MGVQFPRIPSPISIYQVICNFHEIVHGAGSRGWRPDGDPWNYQWELFFRPVPAPANLTPKTADEIIEFKDQLVDVIKDRHQTAGNIAWPKPTPPP